jgi:hypothetical protein
MAEPVPKTEVLGEPICIKNDTPVSLFTGRTRRAGGGKVGPMDGTTMGEARGKKKPPARNTDRRQTGEIVACRYCDVSICMERKVMIMLRVVVINGAT